MPGVARRAACTIVAPRAFLGTGRTGCAVRARVAVRAGITAVALRALVAHGTGTTDRLVRTLFGDNASRDRATVASIHPRCR